MTSSSLLSLPEELQANIASYVHPNSLVSLSLACRELYRVTKSLLLLEKQYHELYHVCHDRKPLTTPALLRLAVSNPRAAWHIRCLELWGLRPTWQKWKTWIFTYGNYDENDEIRQDWPDPREDYSHYDQSFFDPRELEKYESIMRDQLRLHEAEIEDWMGNVRGGWDEPLKGMLMALAPALDRVQFVAYDSWQSTEMHDKHPLTFLCLGISRIYHSPDVLWPAGFQSLRKISVCTTTSMRHPHDAFYASPSAVAPLFLLPNIKILHLSLLGYHDDEDEGYFLPEGCSTVEELGFYCCSLDVSQTLKLISAAKRLKRFTCLAGCPEPAKVVTRLADRYGNTLEELSIPGQRALDPHLLLKFARLKFANGISIADLLSLRSPHEDLPIWSNVGGARLKSVSVAPRSTVDQLAPDTVSVEVADLRELLPQSIERLAFVSQPKLRIDDNTVHKKGQRELLSMLGDLVNDSRFDGLKEVCLYDIGNGASGQGLFNCGWDQAALDRIKASGVDVHIVSDNGADLEYQKHMKLHRYSDTNSGLDMLETDPRPIEQQYR